MRRLVGRTWPIALVAVIAAIAVEAAARPGGGHSYSGGGGGGGGGFSGGSGGGGGDGGALVYLLVRLVIEVPEIGIPLLLIVGAAYLYHLREKSSAQADNTWDSAPTVTQHAPRRRADLGAIRSVDPEFSAVLFGDFVYALYARAHAARADVKAMDALAPYAEADTRAALLARNPSGVPIHGVVIGSMSVEAVRVPETAEGMIEVELQFEANYAAVLPDGEKGYYVRELWKLRRSAAARSRPPESVTALGCPSCGAPFQRSDADRCSACGQQVEGGRFDWTVFHVRLLGQQPRPPPLTHHAEEVGTDHPTRFAPHVQRVHEALIADDPETGPAQLEGRARAIFAAMNEGWTSLDLSRTRPFVSDALFNYLQYWIEAYRAQGLRNVIERPEFARMAIVKVERDRHYDAITVRIWASCVDYTIQAQSGRRIAGSNRHPRRYSEYWTLIRGASVRGAPRDPATCPNCGAGLDRVSMAGTCEYCNAHLTRGEFDWVLSKIEQDEAYGG